MNAVLGMLYLLLQGNLDDRQRDFALKAHRAAQSLLGLINDILDFSKIDAGKLVIDEQPFELGAVVAQAIETVEFDFRAKGLRLEHTVQSGAPPELLGDAQRLQQALVNLLGNALKFTEHGQVSLRVAYAFRPDGQVELSFVVEDTGIGMDKAQLAALFQPFSQVDPSASRRFQGTGLGLAITQRLVELMGGAIRVYSTPGLGSVFSFTVLCAPSASSSAKARGEILESLAPVSSALRGSKVLVVDDNEVNCLLAVEMLRLLGVESASLSDGAGVVDHLRAHADVDCVLMDCQMPVQDGFETTRQIRQHPEWRELPVIAMTADAMEQDREACLAAGMNDYLSKPIDIERLRAVLSIWLDKPKAAPASGVRRSS
jgi:CheY-like chemotaxis protein